MIEALEAFAAPEGSIPGPVGSPALVVLLALLLASVAAVAFAWAATWHHEAVGRRFRLERVVRSPRWLAGIALTGAGALLHIGALALAPVSVVQPVGVLAVPAAVALGARRHGRRPARRTVTAAVATVLGVATLVTAIGFSSPHEPGTLPSARGLWWTAGLVLLGALAAAGLGCLGPRWLRCVSLAGAGAVAFGLASALLRAVFVHLAAPASSGEGGRAAVAGLVLLIAGAYVLGGWLVQQGYAAGSPDVVLGCLTVLDPLVAVCLGVVALGEGAGVGARAAGVAALGAGVAAIGLVALARSHPAPGSPSSPPSTSTSTSPSTSASTPTSHPIPQRETAT